MGNEKVNYLQEIEAMGTIANALDPLPSDSVQRVLGWAIEAFSEKGSPSATKTGAEAVSMANDGKGEIELEEWRPNDVAELYSAVDPNTDAEKALLATYWLMVEEGETDVDSQSINSLLKHLGYGVGNITRAFSSLINTRPQLVIQTRKTGKTKQARKRYKLTEQGKKEIEKHFK